MPQIEVDKSARDILQLWKGLYGQKAGARIDYSEAIRCAHAAVLKQLERTGPAARKKKSLGRL